MSDDVFTQIDLLRHGACEGGEIYRGSTDVPLTQEGWEQMASSVGDGSDWQAVVTSPLERCQTFAQHCSETFSIPLAVESGFREMHFGEWEGRLLTEVWESDAALVTRFYEDPDSTIPPGGESVADAQTRAVKAWDSILRERSGERVLLVCHGGVIRLLLSHVLQMPRSAISRLHVPYGSLTKLRVYHRDGGDFPVLLSLNSMGEHS